MIVAVEINPAVWYPYVIDATVDWSCDVLTYLAVPRPATVDVIFRVNCRVDTKEADPRPVTVEASSTGSIKLVI